MNTRERLRAVRLTSQDARFMKEIGIQPCDIERPFQPSLPLPQHDSQAPAMSEEDVSWLLTRGVLLEPEPRFMPPKNLQEYLSRYPNGIRNGVEGLAKELKTGMSAAELNELARQISEMFVKFALNAEDIVETYPQSSPPQPGEDTSLHFHEYFYLCVRAAMLTLLGE